MDPIDLSEYIKQFPRWVKQQEMTESIFSCDSDIRIDHPFPEENSLWSLWADHNCKDYNLLLTLVMDQEVVDKVLGWVGVKGSKASCSQAYIYDGALACEFELAPGSHNFGVLLSGGFSPIFYMTEWI